MPINSAKKGQRREAQIRDAFLAAGIPCRRHGCYEADDLTICIRGRDLVVEVKSRKAGWKTIYDAIDGRDALVIKADRKPALLVMPLSDATALMGEG